MNPMTNVKNIKKLSEQELKRSLKTSWHDQYKGSAWIFVGGLPYDLTEGDIICVFSQYGEVVNLNLVRDKASGKSRGFCFLCYEDQRSTVLAVDNFNSMKLLGRTLRVDHVQDYKAPKDSDKKDDETRRLQEIGCGPSAAPLLSAAVGRATSPDVVIIKQEKDDKPKVKRKKDEKKEKPSMKVKKEKVEKKKKRKRMPSSSSDSTESSDSSSSSESSSSSSDSESSSSEEERKAKKRSKKKKEQRKKKKEEDEKKKNKPSKRHSEEDAAGKESASSKRRKLQEKIQALEKALTSVRSGKGKH